MATMNIAIACQGGGSHAAYTAGVLSTLLQKFTASEDPGKEDATRLKLVGISGTSGGAISALLAWYGFLTGDPDAAERNLKAFWDANSTQWIGEEIWNEAVVRWANSLPYDLKFSPYLQPLHEVEALTTKIWPSFAGWMGGLNRWIREDYFQLAQLIRPHVDFHIVGALGDFCSIPLEIKRWCAADLEAKMYAAGSPRQQQLGEMQRRIEQRIEQKLAMGGMLQQAMTADDVPTNAVLRKAFASWKAPACAFDAGSRETLSAKVLEVSGKLPQLLIGAVEINNGEFTAFSSERSPEDGGISLDAVLASAALPWLFEAQKVSQFDPERNAKKDLVYWDGLFSQNPPIKNFMSGMVDKDKKPNGLWVVQINPNDFHIARARHGARTDALGGNEIWHTRDALSGNLSLNQEIAFVEAINRRLDDPGDGKADTDKQINVDRIVMDASAVEAALGPGYKFGVASKYDRSARLKDALVMHGKAQAERFLELREHVEHVSGNFGAMLQQLSAPAAGTPDLLAGAAPAISADQGMRDAQLVVDGITVHREPRADGAGEPLASVHWHTHGARLDGSQVRIEGDTGLYADGSASWRLREVSVTGPGRAQH